MMADPETKQQVELSLTLIERAIAERASLLQLIEQSQQTIDRSRECIAQLDRLLRGQ